MKFYLESVENTFKEVSSDPHGLSAQEAEARLQKYGKNKLAEGKKVTLLQRFLEQLSDPMLIILMVAAVVSGITNYLSGESPVDVFIIMFVVVQQFEGNVIYPHVVGNSVGLPAIWVLVAVTIGGNIAGIVGMIFSIPFCSVLYQLFSEIVNKQIKKKNVDIP